MCGAPFISTSIGRLTNRYQPLDFLGRVTRPLRNDLHHRRRQVRIGVHGHTLEGKSARYDDEQYQHQDQETLAEGELNEMMNHGGVFALGSALQRVLKLQEQAAVSDDFVTRLQS